MLCVCVRLGLIKDVSSNNNNNFVLFCGNHAGCWTKKRSNLELFP